jgi:hypothetical protein
MPRISQLPIWRRCAQVLLAIAASSSTPAVAEKAVPARPRQERTIELIEAQPQFVSEAHTLDPAEVARDAWRGYLSHMGGPGGEKPELQANARLYFTGRALPWTLLAPSDIDGFDVNTRNVGAHANLHFMLGSEKAADPVEAAQLAYIQSLHPEGEGSFIHHGELAENLIDLYVATEDERTKAWAAKVIGALHAPHDSSDPMGGWLHLHVGWDIGALTKWHAITGDQRFLDEAKACADRVCNSRDPNGDDGAFRADGSFGGKSQATTASWHVHGHTHILPGLITLGAHLLHEGEEGKGLATIEQARRTFDWLYDAERNPDAGSLTGWLGEWLICATGWDRTADCEGCTMGDVVETAVALAAASRHHTTLSDQAHYYDRAEQIFRGHVVESIYRQTPQFLALLRDCAQVRSETGAIGAVAWNDMSAKRNNATLAKGDVSRRQVVFGQHDDAAVLRFDGSGYFTLADSAALRVPEFVIAAVIDVPASAATESQTVYSNYDNSVNWGYGLNFAITPDRHVVFFTSDGTEAGYDPLVADQPLSSGAHVIVCRYGADGKEIIIDGKLAVRRDAKPISFGDRALAAVGALREFGQPFHGDVAELIMLDTSAEPACRDVVNQLATKYGIGEPKSTADGTPPLDAILLWLSAGEGYTRERPEPSVAERQSEAERLYHEAVQTGQKFNGRLLGLCGFNDWVNSLPSMLDSTQPGIDMMGCCSDAVIRAAGAVWKETVTGDANETRVNMAFNRKSTLVEVVSSLPHRGELNILVHDARRVLVRVPVWTEKDKVRAFIDRHSIEVAWDDSYVVFPKVKAGQQLTVVYPLRITEVKETVGSLAGIEYVERWRGNTIVDVKPRGRWLPMHVRPELDTSELP